MNVPRRAAGSDYMEWAKIHSHARYNLATSGIIPFPLHELGVTLQDIELSGPSFYGYEPLQQALARKCAVPQETVVSSVGTSLANHLAMAAILQPGDEVLVERPAYEPLLAVPLYLGARVKRFERRRENGFKLEPEEVERAATPQTRLIVITNLHNPTSVGTGDDVLRQVGEIARRCGARVLVDEVYLEALALQAGGNQGTAFHLGNEFVVTGSLTKAYGLSGLRCGWILAEPELAYRIWRLNDLFGVIPAHPAERLSVVALERLHQAAARARALLGTNRTVLDRFLDGRDDLECVRPDVGTVVFPRLRSGRVDELCTILRDRYQTTVVPGRFFEMPDHFRIGIGCEPAMLAAGLERLSAALDHLPH